MTADLTRLSAAEMARLLATQEVSSVELSRARRDRTAEVDGAVHS